MIRFTGLLDVGATCWFPAEKLAEFRVAHSGNRPVSAFPRRPAARSGYRAVTVAATHQTNFNRRFVLHGPGQNRKTWPPTDFRRYSAEGKIARAGCEQQSHPGRRQCRCAASLRIRMPYRARHSRATHRGIRAPACSRRCRARKSGIPHRPTPAGTVELAGVFRYGTTSRTRPVVTDWAGARQRWTFYRNIWISGHRIDPATPRRPSSSGWPRPCTKCWNGIPGARKPTIERACDRTGACESGLALATRPKTRNKTPTAP